MNVLVLEPGASKCRAAAFRGREEQAGVEHQIQDCRDEEACRAALTDMLGILPGAAPDLVAVRSLFGGSVFRGPAVVTSRVLEQLEELIPRDPLHLPAVLAVVRACGEALPGTPIVAVFETSFFVDLPARERLYALDFERQAEMRIRRYGFHGLFHEAACVHVGGTRRLLSICLDRRPEVAAVMGMRPVMVTSGTTPLEGLPGETTCGEIDPSIVIKLAELQGWGPEQINHVLTRTGGLRGLLGRPCDFEEIFAHEPGPDVERARRIVQYRLLQACGAGVAAMGGLDAIVFSGRYAGLGETLGPWLVGRLPLRGIEGAPPVRWVCFREPLDRILAEIAVTAALSEGLAGASLLCPDRGPAMVT